MRIADQTHYIEHVVLVDDRNVPIGTAQKSTVHTDAAPLHRGFSLFIFNRCGELLLQQRSKMKVAWPLTWTNSCCGHPASGESPEDAARRRASDELNLKIEKVHVVLPNYRYRFEKDGIVENEFCPVMVTFTSDEPRINPKEAESTRWVSWNDFVKEVSAFPERYSPWCAEETQLLDDSKAFNIFFKKHAVGASSSMNAR
jgi:isopentenyl-diphosphate Delta-isomerase